MTVNCTHLNWLLLGVFLIFSVTCALAQEGLEHATPSAKAPDTFSVNFVAAFSSSKDIDQAPGFGKSVFEFIFGEDDERLMKPVAVTVTSAGQIFIIDQGQRSLITIDREKKDFDSIESVRKQGLFSLVSVCQAWDDVLLFADSEKNKLFSIGRKKKRVRPFAASVTLNQPTGLAYHPLRDEVWVVETKAHRIVVLDRHGKRLRTIGARGTGKDDFNYPTSIWIDAAGTVHVVDSMNFRVKIMDGQGEVLSVFGEPGDSTGYVARSKGIATDSFGHIYVVDGLFHTVQIFDRKGVFLYNFGKQGGGLGEFWLPSGIFIDHKNFIYVADSYNARIQMFKMGKRSRGKIND
ncbi:6-bladed beta-propeller [Oligoflexia bacterium]|nr:6-bladed beta-propeller [Oligoflexia bacterium]